MAADHVMIDLETLGVQPGSIILSIGAVRFNPNDPDSFATTEDSFYRVIGQDSSVAAGLTSDPSTLKWWESQSDTARQVLIESCMPSATELAVALNDLAKFLDGGAIVWSNGANFDQPLLDVAYNRCDIPLPWKYWNSRCYRTVCALDKDEKKLRLPNVGAHNALADAIWQAQNMAAVVKRLGITI